MSVDTIGNFLTVIRNGLMVNKRLITVPSSTLRVDVARVLKEEGYIKDFKVEKLEDNKSNLSVFLKYVEGESVIHEITRISTPGRRSYSGSSDLEPVIGGLGISIITTSKGVITDQKARKLGVGGEVICQVW